MLSLCLQNHHIEPNGLLHTITVSTLSSYRVGLHKGHLKMYEAIVDFFPMLLYIFEQMYLIIVKWYVNHMIGCILFMETLKKNFHLICLHH